jgi:dTDP-4-amino-4,6-dideoxygalactose transaminase
MTTPTKIQLFKPIFNIERILEEIKECLDSGWTGIGFKTLEFEDKFCKYTGIPRSHMTNSATSALHLALEIIKENTPVTSTADAVVTSPLTFVSDAHVILHANLEPMFLDVDEYLCLNPRELENYLDNTYNNIEVLAVIFTGLAGNIGKFSSIAHVCKAYNIPLILDASHMLGTYVDGKHIGNEADYTVFSFQSVKNLPTADAGMLCCKSPKDDQLARKFSWLGISKDTYTRQFSGGNWKYEVDSLGWKYHGNSIMAAMGIAGLEVLKEQNSIRTEQALRYTGKLDWKKYSGIPIPDNCRSSRHLFQVKVHSFSRDKVISYARDKGVELGVHYKLITDFKYYKGYNLFPLSNAELASKQLISLPIGPHLSDEDVSKVIEVMNNAPY